MIEMTETFGSRPLMCFEVEKVIGVSSDGNYQVQWAPAWVSKFHLVGCEHLIQEFLQQQQQQDTVFNSNILQLPQQQQQQLPQQLQLPQQPQPPQQSQQQLSQNQQPLETAETFPNVKYEEYDEEMKEPCNEIAHFQSSSPPPSTTHSNSYLSSYIMNTDIHQNTPEVNSVNSLITDTSELVDDSGSNNSLQKQYSHENSFAGNLEVKQEDDNDLSVYRPVDESTTTTDSNKVIFS